ncbi:MAG: hypothetical protein ABJB21_05760 [bacterium]
MSKVLKRIDERLATNFLAKDRHSVIEVSGDKVKGAWEILIGPLACHQW